MTAAFPDIEQALTELEEQQKEIARHTFHENDRVSVRLLSGGPLYGTVLAAHESFGGWIEFRPDGLKENTALQLYFQDPWVIEHIVEVP